jgi:hypothetical protein
MGKNFLKCLIISHGGTYTSMISKTTDFLARNQPGKAMIDKAQSSGVHQVTVGERTKSTREKKGRNKSVSWGGETRAVSHEKTSLEGVLKRTRGQTMWTKDMQGTRMRVTK